MKKLSVFLALFALFFAELALAAGAVVTSTTGTVSVQTGQASPRTLRTGDQVAQGHGGGIDRLFIRGRRQHGQRGQQARGHDDTQIHHETPCVLV